MKIQNRFALLALPCLAALVGCRPSGSSPSLTAALKATAEQTPAPAPTPPPKPALDLLKVRPNEVGAIPVVMYHSLGDPAMRGRPRYDKGGLNIAPETFRKQLERMYAADWYPINLRDMLTARLNVPAGKTPVVLTFDDGRLSQFEYRKDGTIDPDCALGILLAFHAKHPDWPLRGTFYVNSNRNNPVPFGQRGREAKKLAYLLEQGFEIGNHSSTHSFMSRMGAQQLQWEVADCIRYIKHLAPNATMDTFCLPYGAWPREKALLNVLLDGREGGTTYHNLCVVNAWGDPTPPFTHKKFDRKAVLRFAAAPGYAETWIRQLKRGEPMRPFVSDGDPETVTVPKSQAKNLNSSHLEGARLVTYDDVPPKKTPTKQTPPGKKTPNKQ